MSAVHTSEDSVSRISDAELERLFEQGLVSLIHEDLFFSQLMNAMVYVHVPVSDDSKHVRLIQFRHPDGFEAIPFFTSARRSEKARPKFVKTLRVPCVDLFNGTRGATLMLNPNDGGPVLYPEEIASLLDGRTLEAFEKVPPSGGSMDVRPARCPPAALLETLRAGAALAPFIKDVYVLEKRSISGDAEEATLLVYMGVEGKHMDRGARHIVSQIQQMNPRLEGIVDVAVFDAESQRPEFLDELGAEPINRPCIVDDKPRR